MSYARDDTLWLIVDRGFGDYYYRPKYTDTNGVIDTFYFGQQENIALASKGKADSAVYNVSTLTVNKGDARYIWVKDDDGLLHGGRVVVFADSAPRPITAAYSDAQHKFSWSGLDAKDSLATQYRILVKKGSAPDTSDNSPDVAKDWTPGSASEFAYTPANAKPFWWTYTPTQGTGTYFYQIVSRDKRGTKSYSSNALNFDY